MARILSLVCLCVFIVVTQSLPLAKTREKRLIMSSGSPESGCPSCEEEKPDCPDGEAYLLPTSQYIRRVGMCSDCEFECRGAIMVPPTTTALPPTTAPPPTTAAPTTTTQRPTTAAPAPAEANVIVDGDPALVDEYEEPDTAGTVVLVAEEEEPIEEAGGEVTEDTGGSLTTASGDDVDLSPYLHLMDDGATSTEPDGDGKYTAGDSGRTDGYATDDNNNTDKVNGDVYLAYL